MKMQYRGLDVQELLMSKEQSKVLIVGDTASQKASIISKLCGINFDISMSEVRTHYIPREYTDGPFSFKVKFKQTADTELNNRIREICYLQELRALGAVTCEKNTMGFICNDYDISNFKEYVLPFNAGDIVEEVFIEIPCSASLVEENIYYTVAPDLRPRSSDMTPSIEGSSHYLYSDYDKIIIASKADAFLSQETITLIDDLRASADEGKVLFVYTQFDKFVKRDSEDEEERVNHLERLVRYRYDESFYASMIYLGINSNDLLIRSIKRLTNYALHSYKDSLCWDERKLALLFDKCLEKYACLYKNEKNLRSLAYSLSQGDTYYQTLGMCIKPVDDFCSIFMNTLNFYIRTNDARVYNEVKERVSTAVKQIANNHFVSHRESIWRDIVNNESDIEVNALTYNTLNEAAIDTLNEINLMKLID